MAHAARISEIADNLVQSILGVNRDDPIIARTRTAVSRGLRNASHARTNQFEVKSRLDGLVEKFAVLNRDDLSDALQQRLEELPTRSKWLPEILELFLSLSDRPVEKTAPDALATLYAAEHPDEQLTWDDIIRDDPLDEPGIWDDIERGYHSSGDETRYADDDIRSEPTTSTQATSAAGDDAETVASLYVTQPDYEQLDLVKRSPGTSGDSALSVTELTVVRESLSMLRGLPTNIYALDTSTGVVQARPDTSINSVSQRVVLDSLAQFATLGSQLQHLRGWVQSTQARPYVNTCQAVTEGWLVDLSDQLSRLEERYVGSCVNTVVSSIEVLSESQRLTRHLTQLSAIIARVSSHLPFALFDELYDCVCTSQLAGDDECFDMLSSMLYKATQTYLRPVATWVSSGTIAGGHHDFFVAESDAACNLGDLWHSKYVLRRSDDGTLNTPRFMQSGAADMFALGKAKMFLDQLAQASVEPIGDAHTTQLLDFSSTRQELEDCPLMPFADLFNNTLQDWVNSISTDVTPNLKASLLRDRGLLEFLTAIDSIYFSANGALFQNLADSLFDRIRRAPSNWHNNFLLTELVKETLGENLSVDTESLLVTTDLGSKPSNTIQALQAINITYHITWPLQNITREATPQSHAKAFSLLLQVSYAYHTLQSRAFNLRALHSASVQSIHNLAFRIRQTCIVFTTALRTHVTTVARALQSELRAKMLRASNIDAMVGVYAAHKKRLETALLLSANLSPVREAMISGLVLCEQFGPMWDGVMTEELDSNSQLRANRALRRLQTELQSTISFLAAGVRNVSRVGGETLLEALAEQLELIVAR
jgi:gamma-tubulin complex component 5